MLHAGTTALVCTHPNSCLGAEKLHGRKCKREREEKLHENLGVICVAGVILMWAKYSAILDPLFNIPIYKKISK